MPQQSRYPKFEQAIRRNVVDKALAEQSNPTYGIIVEYDKYKNKASVLLTQGGSDRPGQIYHSVPFYITNGVQGRSPAAGQMCAVVFKDGVDGNPMITHLFSADHAAHDFDKHSTINSAIPKFIGGL